MINQYIKGFTLIEVAIVLVIIALAIVASVAPLATQIERSRIAETKTTISDVIEALYGHAAAFGRLPCPAMPATAPADYGVERPIGGGQCTRYSGFVPGRTLGIQGAYNDDGLLLDAWGNPIRYTVSQTDSGGDVNTPDVTSIAGTGQNEIRNTTMATVAANDHLFICDGASGNNNDCDTANPIAQNAVAVVLSLGKDGARSVTGGGGTDGADQQEKPGPAFRPNALQ